MGCKKTVTIHGIAFGKLSPSAFRGDEMSSEIPTMYPGGEIAVYKTSDGEVRVDLHLDQEMVWLTQ